MVERLNLGSGKKYLSGYTNVDLYAKKVDLRADIRELKMKPESCDEILLIHVLEHLEQSEAIKLLEKAFVWLDRGGALVVEMPDKRKCFKLIAKGLEEGLPELLLRGAKGLLGGRSQHQAAWTEWLVHNAAHIMKLTHSGTVPIEKFELSEYWLENGEPHLYVWTASELEKLLIGIGFRYVLVGGAQRHLHGGSKVRDRDMHVLGIK